MGGGERGGSIITTTASPDQGWGRRADMAGPFIGLSVDDGLELRLGKWFDI